MMDGRKEGDNNVVEILFPSLLDVDYEILRRTNFCW
jgi:hypothetical protein